MPSPLLPKNIEAVVSLGGKKSRDYICTCSLLPLTLKYLWYFMYVLIVAEINQHSSCGKYVLK